MKAADRVIIARTDQAAALCDRAEGRLAPDGTGALTLLADQWADAKRTWDDPDTTAYQVALGTVTTLIAAFPNDNPRAVLSAAAALLRGRAWAMEMNQ